MRSDVFVLTRKPQRIQYHHWHSARLAPGFHLHHLLLHCRCFCEDGIRCDASQVVFREDQSIARRDHCHHLGFRHYTRHRNVDSDLQHQKRGNWVEWAMRSDRYPALDTHWKHCLYDLCRCGSVISTVADPPLYPHLVWRKVGCGHVNVPCRAFCIDLYSQTDFRCSL